MKNKKSIKTLKNSNVVLTTKRINQIKGGTDDLWQWRKNLKD